MMFSTCLNLSQLVSTCLNLSQLSSHFYGLFALLVAPRTSRSQVTGGQNGSVLSSSEFYRPELDEWQAHFWQMLC